MSWDISLTINTGIKEREIVDCGNYTYNVSDMYVKAMGKSLSDLHGKKAKDVIPLLKTGVKAMLTDPIEMKKLSPENGWGDYDGALEYLQGILKACEENPECIVRVH